MKNKICGIYLITEKSSRRDVYVGQSIGIEGRWSRHWKKFPQERFDYRILLECLPAELNFWEQHYIRVLKTHWSEGGENQDWGGQHWPKPEEPLSPATRAKISAALSVALKGRVKGPMSEEQKMKLSEAQKGRVQPEEEKAKRSAALKGRVAPNKGKPMSEETKAKISAAKKGKVQSEEHRAKNSAAQKGRVPPNKGVPMSLETKAKQSAALKGRPKSEEQKMKLSAAAKARAALKRAAKAAAVAALEALLFAETETILSPE